MKPRPHPEAEAEGAFAAACLDPGAPPPGNLRAESPAWAERRFAVYRNNVVVSLMEALAAKFPATEAVVGAEFFRAAARLFVRAHPPRSPLLWRFGDEFPRFLEAFAPTADLAYLPDLARLEATVQAAFHAPDAAPLSPEALARLTPEAAMGLPLALHPAAHLLRSEHPVATIWRMNRGLVPLGVIADWSGEDALVTRPELDVRVIALPHGGAAFLERVSLGARLGEAADAVLKVPGADLSRILGAVISAGALVSSPTRQDQP